ncbi:hypothetical protein F511_32529 [Dorcoceras hygrometricum]|uniref:Uncharacterized protein n=1 Tax=Dorcoceras hygrometricum TaxID=472368 RepID=A0A2Z7CBW1_9LAMI|nr:hypothetical protein F511_32529 [Dorcoceras hygrometricum]
MASFTANALQVNFEAIMTIPDEGSFDLNQLVTLHRAGFFITLRLAGLRSCFPAGYFFHYRSLPSSVSARLPRARQTSHRYHTASCLISLIRIRLDQISRLTDIIRPAVSSLS